MSTRRDLHFGALSGKKLDKCILEQTNTAMPSNKLDAFENVDIGFDEQDAQHNFKLEDGIDTSRCVCCLFLEPFRERIVHLNLGPTNTTTFDLGVRGKLSYCTLLGGVLPSHGLTFLAPFLTNECTFRGELLFLCLRIWSHPIEGNKDTAKMSLHHFDKCKGFGEEARAQVLGASAYFGLGSRFYARA